MPKFRKKPIIVEAHRWFVNGDHPQDYTLIERTNPDSGKPYAAEFMKGQGWEGAVVRYYRTPSGKGNTICLICTERKGDHGWIDTVQGGHIVCPGDWIITDDRVADPRGHGHFYPCKPDIFEATYEPVE